MPGEVVIDYLPESAQRYRTTHAIVVIDVIRATTTAATAVSLGRRVFPVQTTDEAFIRASTLQDPLLAGELGGNMPFGFEITNSPAQVALREDIHRPMVLVSSSGTRLLLNAVGSEAVYVGCFRNMTALAAHLCNRHKRIAILGAGTRGQFRREDQMGCAWIAEKLVQYSCEAGNPQTADYIARWKGASPEQVRGGRSAEYLLRTGQQNDLEFVLQHLDDLPTVPSLVNGELISLAGTLGQTT